MVKTRNKGGEKSPPKTSTERGRTRTAKDDAWAYEISAGKYPTLRTLMKAIHDGKIKLTVRS